jgi:glucans biosynthesis protein C
VTLPQAEVAEARPARVRLGHVDDLKVVLTIGVITTHAAITYGAEGSWFYQEPYDSALSVALTVPLALGSQFGMGLFFLLAGAFTPAALERKGVRRFLADRWLRLGLPFALFVLAVVPLVQWLADAGSGEATSAALEWRDQLEDLDAGPMWFVGVLLLYSTAYGLVAGRVREPGRGGGLTGRLVLVTMAGVALASFVLRLAFPIDSSQIFAAHVWQWGQCAGLFLLGLHAGSHGWLTQQGQVPAGLRRRCAWALAAGAVVVVVMIGLYRDDFDPLAGGFTWPSAVVCATEGVMATAAAVVLPDLFRRRRRGRIAVAAGRSAYGAYILQAPVLVAIALLLRPADLPPAVKLLVLATTAVTTCFAVAATLVRLPGARQVL